MIELPDSAFQAIAQLATGGMGVVYLGLEPASRTLGALKTMFRQHLRDPVRLERFRKEVRLHSRLGHPQIVACLEACPDAETPSLVLEYLRGRPLSDRLEEGPFPLWEVLELVESLAGALSHLHGQDVLHHDLKPSNVFACRTGRFVLLDMGVAAAAHASEASSRTFLYSAPEVNRQERCDPRADLYSLGLVLFECLTGVRALESTTLAGAIQEQCSASIPDPRDFSPAVPDSLAQLCKRLTAPDPEHRPGSAREILHEIRSVRDQFTGDGENAFTRVRQRGRILDLLARQEFDLALALLEKERLAHPRSPWGHWVLARTQSQRGRFGPSLEALGEAERLGLDRRLILEQRGFTQLQAGRYLDAYATLSELAQERPDDPCCRGLLRWLEEA